MSLDTSPEAVRVQEGIVGAMTTTQRLKMALEMSESMRNVAVAGLRAREPNLSAEEEIRELIRFMYGIDVRPNCHEQSNRHRPFDRS